MVGELQLGVGVLRTKFSQPEAYASTAAALLFLPD